MAHPYEDNTIVNLRIWRQTTQERPFTTKMFGEALCAIYMVDVARDPKQTKAKVANVNQILDKECGDDGIVRILVGNKSDLGRDRQLSKEQGVQLQARYKMDRYIDTSAK